MTRAKRCNYFSVLLLIGGVLFYLFLQLHQVGYTFFWHHQVLSSIEHDQGFSYKVALREKWNPKYYTELWEEDHQLPYFRSSRYLYEVFESGLGRFQLSKNWLYFSSSDNSNPIKNGRTYSLLQPSYFPPILSNFLFGFIMVLMLQVFILTLLIQKREEKENTSPTLLWIKNHKLPFSYGVVVFFFLFTRAGFYLYHGDPVFTPDSISYYIPVYDMDHGNWALWSIRTPGYPLFLKFVFLFSDHWLAVVFLQSLISLFSALFTVWAFHKANPLLTVWIGLAMAVYLGCGSSLIWEVTLLSESLYTNALLLVFAFLTLALHTRRNLFWGLTSLLMALAILIRPSAMFLVVIWAMSLLYLRFHSYSKKTLLALSLPLLMPLFFLCCFNYATLGQFSLSTIGELNFMCATSSFWEKDEEFSPEINQIIDESQRLQSPKEKRLLRESCDPDLLQPIFYKQHYGVLKLLRSQPHFEPETRKIYQKIILKAISQNPKLYAKFFYTSFYYYCTNSRRDSNLYTFTGWKDRTLPLQILFVRTPPRYKKSYLKNYYREALLLMKNKITKREYSRRVPFWIGCYETFLKFHNFLFRNIIWSFLLWGLFFFSGYSLIKTKLSCETTVLLFMMISAFLGSAILTALVQNGDLRFSFPLEFIYYISPPLGLYVILSHWKKPEDCRESEENC